LGEWLVGIKKLCANAGICLLEMKSHRQPRRDSDRLSMPDKSFELPTAYDVGSGFIVTVWQFGRGLRGGHTSGRIQINLDIGGGHSTHLTTPLFLHDADIGWRLACFRFWPPMVRAELFLTTYGR
jgi:hypothetical protein